MADQQLALSAARALRDHGYINADEFTSLEARILSKPQLPGFVNATPPSSNAPTGPVGPYGAAPPTPPSGNSSPPQWHHAAAAAPAAQTPRKTRSKGKMLTLALVVVGLVGAIAFAVTSLNGRHRFTTDISVAVLGSDCDSPGYSDLDQVVVLNAAGDEVAFADLDVADESGGHCHYVGTVTIDDDSPYFRVQSRRESRAALRLDREEAKQGMQLSIGDCEGYDLSYSDQLDCIDFLAERLLGGDDAVEN